MAKHYSYLLKSIMFIIVFGSAVIGQNPSASKFNFNSVETAYSMTVKGLYDPVAGKLLSNMIHELIRQLT